MLYVFYFVKKILIRFKIYKQIIWQRHNFASAFLRENLSHDKIFYCIVFYENVFIFLPVPEPHGGGIHNNTINNQQRNTKAGYTEHKLQTLLNQHLWYALIIIYWFINRFPSKLFAHTGSLASLIIYIVNSSANSPGMCIIYFTNQDISETAVVRRNNSKLVNHTVNTKIQKCCQKL